MAKTLSLKSLQKDVVDLRKKQKAQAGGKKKTKTVMKGG